MLAVSVILDKRRRKKDGTFPVKIRYSWKGHTLYYNTGISVREENFRDGLITGTRTARIYNALLSERVKAVELLLIDHEVRQMDHRAVKALVDETLTEATEPLSVTDDPASLVAVYEAYLERPVSEKTKTCMRVMMNKLSGYTDTSRLLVKEIDLAFLQDFQDYLTRDGLSVNGIGNYMRNIRTLYNLAIDRGVASLEDYPFRRFRIKRGRTLHRDLTLTELIRIRDYDPETEYTGRKPLAFCRDMFMLSFYLCGLNIADLVSLTEEDVRAGYIRVYRKKTAEPIVTLLQPEALEIIERWRKEGDPYLTPLHSTYTSPVQCVRNINDAMAVIQKGVTSYYARHTWATLAGTLGISPAIINAAQGRVPEGMAGIYTHLPQEVIDEANRRVLDLVKGAAEATE